MFVYEKRLQYPVKIKNTNPKLASLIISQYGGPYSIRLRKSRSKPPRLSLFYTTVALMAIPFPAALEELGLALKQRIQVGGLQPCRQPTALVIVQIVCIHQFVPDMYEGHCFEDRKSVV